MHRPWLTPGCIASLWLVTIAISVAADPPAPALTNSQSLSFGRFAAGNGGSVTLSPAGARTPGGNVVLLTSGPGTSAQFSVTGNVSAVYSITLPSDGTVFLTRSGAAPMAVNQFTSSPSGAGLVLSGTGQQPVSVGATLSVGAGATAGSYAGTFFVTVDYP